MTVPPRSVFAAAARAEVDAHDEWDAPHSFQTLHLNGDSLTCRTYACITTDVEPAGYPRLMAKLAAEQHDRDPRDPAYAYLLQVESFGVTEPGPQAPAAEVAAFDAARRGGRSTWFPGRSRAAWRGSPTSTGGCGPRPRPARTRGRSMRCSTGRGRHRAAA